MPADLRPYYDPESRTHYIELPRGAFDATRLAPSGVGMLDSSLFADAVSQGEWVWIECDGDAVCLEVTGIAAVTKVPPRGAFGCTCGTPPLASPEPSGDCPFHGTRGADG